MIQVKICGIRTIDHALLTARAGAAYIGLVFAPSRRQITAEQAQHLITHVRAEPIPQPIFVGLFVNETPAYIRQIAQRTGIDAIQLSGDEPVEILEQLQPWPIFKAIRLAGAASEAAWLSLPGTDRLRLLIDAHTPGSYGGSGTLANWEQAASLAHQQPIMLAGGLTPLNVADAIATVQPWGVDVSSGVESDGIKDPAKIISFITVAQAAGTKSLASSTAKIG